MARLSYQSRKRMKKSEFAVPGKRKGGKGGYPIPDVAHARNALARVAQHGSAAEKAEVRRKVHAKFPGIDKKKETRSERAARLDKWARSKSWRSRR